MSVRIIFRGLILFRFPGGLEKPNQIVAHLINKRDLPQRRDKKDAQGPKEGHEHYHEGLIQILTGDPTEDMAPAPLRPLEDIDITVNDGTGGVVIEESFLRHVPQLSDVIGRGKGEVRGLIKQQPDIPTRPDLIQNTITVNRGRVRVRNVVTWDQGGFPLSQETQLGAVPASHARINFVGSEVSGFFASEFVVDIPDATGVTLKTKFREKDQKANEKLNRSPRARNDRNHRVRVGSVEILITNYEFQGGEAVPWGLDFQWLFEALGYAPVDLGGAAGLDDFAGAARRYDEAARRFAEAAGRSYENLYENEVRMLLGRRPGAAGDAPDSFTVGLPFPYIPSPAALVSVRQGTDEESRPICIGGFQGGGP